MKRLTYKRGRGILVENNIEYDTLNNVCYQDCVDKLGQLEDIEEELGIGLTIIFKALKNGVYVRYTNDEIEHRIVAGIEEENITLCIKENKECYMYFDEYGKTWALTKEDLK